MRQKILLGRCAVPKQVRLPDGTSFVARYERISRKNLPGNRRVTKTRTIRVSKGMSKGISNFQIENAIDNIGDEDLNNNFLGVFPSNRMNKFINHSAMISSKKGKYPFVIANTDIRWDTLVEYT